MDICSICNKEVKIYDRNKMVCQKCYYSIYQAPLAFCINCGKEKEVAKRTKKGPICQSCYSKEHNTGICYGCNKIKVLHKITPNGKICQKCYNKLKPKEFCSICNKLSAVIKRTKSGEPICRSCWEEKFRPKKICSGCSQLKKIDKKDTNLCQACYTKNKKQTNEKFRVTTLLRDRVRNAFKKLSKNGKVKKSKEYDIDYEAIYIYLGPCPGNREDFEIDHIFPLAAFNLDDPKHIRLAFAPENHQWLDKKENRIKYCSYDENLFKQHLENFKATPK